MVLFFASNEPCYKKSGNTSGSLLTKKYFQFFYNTANAAKVSSSAANFRHGSLLSQPALADFGTPHYSLNLRYRLSAWLITLSPLASRFRHASSLSHPALPTFITPHHSLNLLSPFRLQQYLILLRRHGFIEIVALYILSALILNEFYLLIRFHAF